jgi:hypothetical protein
MIELVAQLKLNLGLKMAIISNEARELNAYRIDKVSLNRLADFFISLVSFTFANRTRFFQACSRYSSGAARAGGLHLQYTDVRSDC